MRKISNFNLCKTLIFFVIVYFDENLLTKIKN